MNDFDGNFNAPSQKLTSSSHGLGFAIIAVLTVVGAPFFEEVFFRGLLLASFARLFGNLGRWVGPALAIVITGVLFGLAHAESLQLVGLATFGIILSFVSYRTGRLGMNMVSHATFNLVRGGGHPRRRHRRHLLTCRPRSCRPRRPRSTPPNG